MCIRDREGSRDQWLLFIGVTSVIFIVGLYLNILLAWRCIHHRASHWSIWTCATGILLFLVLGAVDLGLIAFYINADRRSPVKIISDSVELSNRIFYLAIGLVYTPFSALGLLFLGALTPVQDLDGNWALRRDFDWCFYFKRITPAILWTTPLILGSLAMPIREHGVSNFGGTNLESQIFNGVASLFAIVLWPYMLCQSCKLGGRLQKLNYLESRTEQLIFRFTMVQMYCAFALCLLYAVIMGIYNAKHSYHESQPDQARTSSSAISAESTLLVSPLVFGWCAIISTLVFFPDHSPKICGLSVHVSQSERKLPSWSRVMLGFRFSWDAYCDLEAGISTAEATIKPRDGMRVLEHLHGGRDSHAIIGVCDTSGEMAIGFRGTASIDNMMTDLSVKLTKFSEINSRQPPVDQRSYLKQLAEDGLLDKIAMLTQFAECHSGFVTEYSTLRNQLLASLESLASTRRERVQLLVTGHSLGGALATLCSVDVSLLHPEWDVTLVNFGSPRVGNHKFAKLFNRVCTQAFRICNQKDIITSVPKLSIAKCCGLAYKHIGNEVVIDSLGNCIQNLMPIERMFLSSGHNSVTDHSMHKYEQGLVACIKEGGAEGECEMYEFTCAEQDDKSENLSQATA
eukprot:TRINITY_DN3462_c0_g1_i7.p1 TRINITY_DN3462_c0_g1~~TRINITY_DN3462_c0_g1_i7.p1  ORF type:complete len:628 (+),score=150.03 TRINITY_DN3462_c0_g1_i7:186-2069(+)